jgi:hypothetical protein
MEKRYEAAIPLRSLQRKLQAGTAPFGNRKVSGGDVAINRESVIQGLHIQQQKGE